MDNRIIYTIIGAVAGAAILYFFFWPSIEERREITYKTETVTFYDTTDVVNIIDSINYKEVINYREVSPEPEKYDSIRTYSGFEKHLYGRINWTAKTGGYLQHLELNPVLTIPLQTVTNTIEKTTTKVIKSKGLYVTGGIDNNFKYRVGAIYIKDRSLFGLFGYEYNIPLKNHALKVGFKVF